MKQMTTNYLYRNETTRIWLRKFYWTKRLTVWTHGYFASTVGQVSEKIVLDYIENQGNNIKSSSIHNTKDVISFWNYLL